MEGGHRNLNDRPGEHPTKTYLVYTSFYLQVKRPFCLQHPRVVRPSKSSPREATAVSVNE